MIDNRTFDNLMENLRKLKNLDVSENDIQIREYYESASVEELENDLHLTISLLIEDTLAGIRDIVEYLRHVTEILYYHKVRRMVHE